MLNLNAIMLGSKDSKALAGFYEKVFGRQADMIFEDWFGWQVGSAYLNIGPHSEVDDKAKEPARMIFNFETTEVQAEFDRIKSLGGVVIAEPYDMDGGLIATLADPDGNYFQLVTPWEQSE